MNPDNQYNPNPEQQPPQPPYQQAPQPYQQPVQPPQPPNQPYGPPQQDEPIAPANQPYGLPDQPYGQTQQPQASQPFQTPPVLSPIPAPTAAAKPTISSMRLPLVLGITTLLVITVGVAIFMFSQGSQDPKTNNSKPNHTSNNSPARLTGFAASLAKCEKSVSEFEHPLTGEKLNRTISGQVDGKCEFVEAMPNDGKMTCRLTAEQQAKAATYYEEYAKGTEPASNVVEEFTADGTCLITGYEGIE